ncbi:MAG: ArsC/Spx/MgsR family protein [Candidatus Acidiferrales bacterium]
MSKNKTAAKSRKARAAGSSVSRAKRKSVQFLQKPTCTSCRNARAYMEKRGFDLHFRDLDKQRLSAAELEELIGDRDHRDFLNTRNELYRAKNMKQNPPSRAEAIRMMAETPNLIRRPVIIAGGRIVLGFDENGIDTL